MLIVLSDSAVLIREDQKQTAGRMRKTIAIKIGLVSLSGLLSRIATSLSLC